MTGAANEAPHLLVGLTSIDSCKYSELSLALNALKPASTGMLLSLDNTC